MSPAAADNADNADNGQNAAEAERAGKSERVREMFSDIAPTYDLLNRLTSLGIDQRWRAQAAAATLEGLWAAGGVPELLDVACGTGDLAFALKRQSPNARIIGADSAPPMLELAAKKARKLALEVEFITADGTQLPFETASFDAVTIAYGLRNFADVDAGLREFLRVLRPGGRLVVLEFPPPPKGLLGSAYRFYFRRLLPLIGGLVSGKRSAYSYLPESVLAFFTPEALEERLHAAGFTGVTHRLQTFGISALHVANRPANQ